MNVTTLTSSNPPAATGTPPVLCPFRPPVKPVLDNDPTKSAAQPPAGPGAFSDEGPASLLGRAFPHRVGDLRYEPIGEAVVQANAEGARYVLTWEKDSGGDEAGGRKETEEVFVKRVDAAKYGHKKWADLRRTLVYARTECRFYAEILPLLRSRFGTIPGGYDAGSRTGSGADECEAAADLVAALAPRCHLAECDLSGLIGDGESATDTSAGREVGDASPDPTPGRGGSLVLASLGGASSGYYQGSPLTRDEAALCLEAVARLHAAAWEDATVLSAASRRLSDRGGCWHLRIRNPKELAGAANAWEGFRERFRRFDPDLFDMPGVRDLGRRVATSAERVSDELSPLPDGPYATLIHGDYKAMNVFLPRRRSSSPDEEEGRRRGAVMIDYASTGVGLGMSDVAMLLTNALRSEDLENGGEQGLLDGYLDALHRARECIAMAAAASRGDAGDPVEVRPYPREQALRHYRLATIDYFRFILGRFYVTATPETFEKHRDSKNRTLVNRDVRAMLAFVRRVENYLSEFDASISL